MIRRSGAFGHQKYSTPIVPTKDDSKELLQSKWKKWAEEESFKRYMAVLAPIERV